MPVFGSNGISQIVLARQVDAARHYIDLLECRGPEVTFWLVDPTGVGTVISELTEAEMLARLASWPIRVPRWDQNRLPYGDLTENGRAWLGWPEGAVP